MLSAFLLLLASIPCAPAAPIAQREQAMVELEPEKLEGLVEALATKIEDLYVFPDVAHQIGAKLRERLYAGAYEGVGLETLTVRLTTDLRSVNNDKHLGVSPLRPRQQERAPDPAQQDREFRAEMRRSNYGFQKVEILDGNIGYLELSGFASLELGRDTAAGAMAFLANVDALIFDLRRNGGGDPTMIQFLTTYLLAERTHLNSFEWRGRDGLEEFWTFDEVPGKRLVDVPVFVLTSSSTFSAAEEFTYNLRNLERATIVGATTGGGAHPGGGHEIAGLIGVFIPQGRAINPITKTNWEGVGVEPHVKVPAEQALDAAKREAARAIAERRKPPAAGG
jgi:hypothetical protein